MSADAALTDDLPVERLPRRTWRQWWDQLPAWGRMLVWAGVGLAFLHLAFAARIFIGQIEAREIKALRRRNVFLQYAWERQPERFFLDHWLLAGLHGKSCDSVVDLRPGASGTDADLALIGRYFHHVKYLNLQGAEITSTGMPALRGCPQLEVLNLQGTGITSEGLQGLTVCRKLWVLDLCDTDVDDEGVKLLAELPALKSLGLAGTCITDESLAAFQKFPKLDFVSVWHTELLTHDTRPPVKLQLVGHYWSEGYGLYPHGVVGAIVWPDGSRSGQFRGRYEIAIEGPLSGETRRIYHAIGSRLTRKELWWNAAQFREMNLADGDYRFTLTLGDHAAEPVVTRVLDHADELLVLEFRMPVTREEALQ